MKRTAWCVVLLVLAALGAVLLLPGTGVERALGVGPEGGSAGPRVGPIVRLGIGKTPWPPGLLPWRGDREKEGFALETARAALWAAGYRVEVVSMTLEDLPQMAEVLKRGDVDVIAGVPVMASSMQHLDFSAPLVVARGGVTGRKGVPAAMTVADLRQGRVLVLRGTSAQEWCVRNGVAAETIDRREFAMEAVATGKADWFLNLLLIDRAWVNETGAAGVEVHPFESTGLERAYSVAGLPKSPWLHEINRGLSLLHARGQYEALYDRWLARYQPRPAAPVVDQGLALRVGSVLLVAAVSGLVGLVYTVVRLRAKTREINDSRARYRAVADTMPALIHEYFVGKDGTLKTVYVNAQWAGWSAAFPFMRTDVDYAAALVPHVHPEDRENYCAAVEQSRKTGERFEVQYRLKDAAGKYRRLHCVCISTPAPLGLNWRAMLVDLSATDDALAAKAEAEKRLAETSARLRAAVDGAGMGTWVMNVEERMVDADPAYRALFGVEGEGPVPLERLRAMVVPEDLPKVERALTRAVETDGRYRCEFRVRRAGPGGAGGAAGAEGVRWVTSLGNVNRDAQGRAVSIAGATLDTTEAHNAAEREKAREAQRQESLSLMAGGIAHDYNNLLAGIMGHAEAARAYAHGGAEVRAALLRIRDAAKSAAEITRQLLVFAGQSPVVTRPVDLAGVAREIAPIIERRPASTGVTVGVDAPEGLPTVTGDRGELTQVVMNLISNAVDAAQSRADGGRGSVSVRVSSALVDAAELEAAAVRGAKEPGAFVVVEVRDNGPGMTGEVLSKAFDPFYSTKSSGRGLGLAIVRRSVERHGGFIGVRSVTGEGTVFRFGLPATGAPVQDAGGHGEAPSGQRGEATSGARFALVVDDMPLVRDALVSMLRSLGWEAAGFGSVEEAAAEGAVPAGIAPGVVLLDFTIPGTSPGENAARLRGRFPGAALLLVSGYAAPAVGGSDAQPDGFLQKPFSAEGLLEAVTAAMEQARGRAGLAEGAVGGGVGGSVNAAAYSPGRR